ncbi:unnamed protein product [Danaus chrysippus]|uniref:(African queen) hypothetical protein n=1 Tax=Danaus chrysippus TaxID=151541 RepID=A0A8J2R6S4_9NEOP|nr:unnamed protein product [Danaus chrysippus]
MSLVTHSNDNFLNSDCINNESSNWNTLYGSTIWTDSRLRDAIVNAPCKEHKTKTYCYTCRGKIRNYGVTPLKTNFLPNNHSTPKLNLMNTATKLEASKSTIESCPENICSPNNSCRRKTSINDINFSNVQLAQNIPTISQHVDGNVRSKFTSTEYVQPINVSQRRLRKRFKGIGCVVNFSLNDSPKKKRTKMQACSIGLMIVAIVLISLILVNFTTPSFIHATNETSASFVPIEDIYFNETTSAVVSIYPEALFPSVNKINVTYETTTEDSIDYRNKSNDLLNIISKIRKNIKTYPRVGKKTEETKDIVNRDLSADFCSCQTNEVCMLDEKSGTSICQVAIDLEDPTGCGGLCALETEACQLVDKSRGVRICKLLTQIKCSPHDWRCRDGFCVPSAARCDGFIQCYDRSDEMHCECDLKKQFRCGNSISCFPNKKKCDGFIDCWDGYDEVNCTLECPEDQFTCNDGQCIISSRFCDGLADCADGSDEPQGCGGACGTHEVQCRNHRCVPRSAVCDGQNDCGDNSDESQCS